MLRMNGVSSLTFWFNEKVIGFITSYSILLNDSPYGTKDRIETRKAAIPIPFYSLLKTFFQIHGVKTARAYFVWQTLLRSNFQLGRECMLLLVRARHQQRKISNLCFLTIKHTRISSNPCGEVVFGANKTTTFRFRKSA